MGGGRVFFSPGLTWTLLTPVGLTWTDLIYSHSLGLIWTHLTSVGSVGLTWSHWSHLGPRDLAWTYFDSLDLAFCKEKQKYDRAREKGKSPGTKGKGKVLYHDLA